MNIIERISTDFEIKSGLQLSKINVSQEYKREWNTTYNDFVVLTRDGKLIYNHLLRVGGINYNLKVGEDKYFIVLKYVESEYSDEFLKECYPKKTLKERNVHKKYLEGLWTIFDKEGNEKKCFKRSISYPHLVSRESPIYSIDKKYYNIETGECYSDYALSSFESKEFLFLENKFCKDESKKGIMKINKLDGTWELFK